jgi:hypothetical protein
MQARSHQPIVGPSVWRGAELQHATEWLRPFTPHELAEIDAALAHVKRRGIAVPDITREDFPLPSFARELERIGAELESGRGMIMLRGLPLAYAEDDLRTVYWGLGTHLGTPLSQNASGELLGVVKDFGPMPNTKRRGSKTADGLDFHSDRCDVVGLLCVRKARSGGESRIVSATALHNEVLRRRPDLIDTFYSEFHHSWQGEEPPGQGRAYTRPLFAFREGYFTGLFSPAYIRFAQEYEEVPRLSEAQSEALALFNALAEELALSMNFEPGDIQLLNNHVIYHGRTRFEDYPEDERKRLLLRLWLSVPGSRPLPRGEGYEAVLGNIEPGAVRGGVPCRDGWWRTVDEYRARRAQATSSPPA